MAEELRIVWLDGGGSGGGANRSQSTSTAQGAPSSGGGAGSSAGMRETSTRSTSKEDSDTSSIVRDLATTFGFGYLAVAANLLVGRFESLASAIDFFTGKIAAKTAGANEAGGASVSPQDEPFVPGAGVNPFKSTPDDDFIEGEFTPKTSAAKSMIPAPAAVGAQVLEGEVVGGVGAVSTEVGGAAAGAIEGQLATAATSAGMSLAGMAAIALPLTVALTAVVGGLYLFKLGLTQAYKDIENLEGFSGELSGANSMALIRQEMGEMRRAERLGPQLAELSDITSRGQETLYSIQTEILKAFLDWAQELRPLVESAITTGKLTAAVIPSIKENLDVVVTVMTQQWANVPQELAEAMEAATAAGEKIAAILLEQEEQPPIDDPQIRKFFDGVNNLFNPPPPAPPPPGPPGGFP